MPSVPAPRGAGILSQWTVRGGPAAHAACGEGGCHGDAHVLPAQALHLPSPRPRVPSCGFSTSPTTGNREGAPDPDTAPPEPERTERVSTRGSGRAGAEERPSDSGRWQAERRPGPPPRDPGHTASRLPGRSERNSLEHRGHLLSQLGSHKGNWTGGSDPLGFQATEGTFPRAPGKCSGGKCVGVSLLDS